MAVLRRHVRTQSAPGPYGRPPRNGRPPRRDPRASRTPAPKPGRHDDHGCRRARRPGSARHAGVRHGSVEPTDPVHDGGDFSASRAGSRCETGQRHRRARRGTGRTTSSRPPPRTIRPASVGHTPMRLSQHTGRPRQASARALIPASVASMFGRSSPRRRCRIFDSFSGIASISRTDAAAPWTDAHPLRQARADRRRLEGEAPRRRWPAVGAVDVVAEDLRRSERRDRRRRLPRTDRRVVVAPDEAHSDGGNVGAEQFGAAELGAESGRQCRSVTSAHTRSGGAAISMPASIVGPST